MQTKINQKTFAGQSFYVGIDCHKKSWKVTVLGEQLEHKTMSQDPVPEQLAGYLKKHFPGGSYHAVYEAGFSGFSACRRLGELGVDCMVVHPADVPTNQKERLQKTDKADSRKLAKLLRSGDVEGIHIPDRHLEADRALLRQRYRLVRDVSRIKNRVKSLLFQFGIAIPDRFTQSQTRYWSKAYMTWLRGLPPELPGLQQVIENYLRIGEVLRKELLRVNAQVRALSRSEAYKCNYRLLTGIPGIGPVAAMTLLVQTGDMGRFRRLDEVCNYVGLVPRMHGSGDKMTVGKLVNRGRKELKILLIEASWVAVRKDPALLARFNALIRTMPKNKAIIRIARKLLSRIRYVLMHRQPYEWGVVK